MHMQVGDLLAGGCSVRLDAGQTSGAQAVHKKTRGSLQRRGYRGNGVRGAEFRKVLDVPAREEQCVPSTDRCDVEDGDRPLGLDDYMRCSTFCDDFSERARQPLWPVPDHRDSNREVLAALRNSGLQSTDSAAGPRASPDRLHSPTGPYLCQRRALAGAID